MRGEGKRTLKVDFIAEMFIVAHLKTWTTSCAVYDSVGLKKDSRKRSPSRHNCIYVRFQTIFFVFCMALFVIVFDVVDRPEMLFLLDEAAALPLPKVSLAIVATVVCVAFLLAAGRLSSSGLPLGRIMSLVLRAVPGMRGSLETRNVGSTRSTANGCEVVRDSGFCAFIAFRERDRCGSDDLW